MTTQDSQKGAEGTHMVITRTCPCCKAILVKYTWLQPWKCWRCGWE